MLWNYIFYYSLVLP